MPRPCLCLVTDRSLVGSVSLIPLVVQAVEGGVDMVQLREKDLPSGQLLKLAQSLKDAIQDKALLIINERVDITMVIGASGVQLGEDGLPVEPARRLLGPEYLIGRSVHTVAGAVLAQTQGAGFLVAGTMYATRSHPGSAPAGPGLVEEMAEKCRLPIIGIGGITPDNLGPVIQAGACGVAVITSILASDQPRRAAEELKQALLEAVSGMDNGRGMRAIGRSGEPIGGNDQA
ncbi:MAG: thiamine phosphate synthase [Chloroflexi bacterium]|nr:thiamine phosphate synthase [Chloroflexota bacterium]